MPEKTFSINVTQSEIEAIYTALGLKLASISRAINAQSDSAVKSALSNVYDNTNALRMRIYSSLKG